MPSHGRLILAVFKRNFTAYFLNPTGYVFITVFILLGAMAAFWRGEFFLNNLANLDQLNGLFPMLLLFFIPALTMNVWSEERRLGTEELLFTLPGSDRDIVVGKYLAVLGIYTVAVLFSLSHVAILAWLGDPDWGLIIANYLGYWLAGAALIAVSMIGSQLTANATVAFILGAALCGVFIGIEGATTIFGDTGSALARGLSLRTHFDPLGDGVVPLVSVAWFVLLAGAALALNVALIARRHARGGEHAAAGHVHLVVRTLAGAVALVALLDLAGRADARIDFTSERLHSLQPKTLQVVAEIPEDRPVFVQAFFSREVPEMLVQTRKNLLNVLRRLDAAAGSRLDVIVHEVEPYTELAATARDNYQITPQEVGTMQGSQRSSAMVFLGLVFTSGPEEFVIPFFDRGLPVEYELARSIRVVSATARRKVGVLATDADPFGGFDWQNMSSSPEWSFVAELRKQYRVENVSPDGPYPSDLDALVAVLPSSLSQEQMMTLQEAILAGTPTLLIDDPLPIFNANLAPTLEKDAGRNPFTSQGQPPAPPKGNFDALLAQIGLRWRAADVVWSAHNPHPQIADAAPEIVFLVKAPDNAAPFNENATVSQGLQEIVALYPGFVEASTGAPDSLVRTPLLSTGRNVGLTAFDSIMQRSFFGMQMNRNPRRTASAQPFAMAMQVRGTKPAAAPPPGGDESGAREAAAQNVSAIFIADVDMISETFFNLRRQGFEQFNFDNVTFALNCIDALAGDESFVELRRHRPRHRSLARVESITEQYASARRAEAEEAEARAATQLAEAQARLDERVAEVRNRSDLDGQTREIMLRNLEDVENRRLEVKKASIEQEKESAMDRARTSMEAAVSGVQRSIKWWAALLPPVPTLLLALGLFAHRAKRERLSAAERRLVHASSSENR